MKVSCPSCGRVIPGGDIHLESRTAVCRPCSEVVSLPRAEPPSAPAARDDARLSAPEGVASGLYRPADLDLREVHDGSASELHLVPNRLAAVPLLFFALVWDGFLVFWYGAATFNGGGPAGIMFWFPLLHVLAGVAITYQALCTLFNRARVTLDGGRFRFRHAPLPRKGAVDEDLAVVERFVAAEAARGGFAGAPQPRGRGRWCVEMLTRDGRAVALGLDLATREHAQYVAARLDHALATVRAPRLYR